MSKEKQPFRFTEEQRNKNLLSCWKRDKERDKAKAYLDSVEPRIKTWRELKALSPSRTHAEIRDACKEFSEKLTDVRTFLEREREKLYALIGVTHSTEEEQVIREAARQLRESSAVLAESSRKTADSIQVSTGPEISKECWLVAMLAELYREVFHKEPSVTPGSNFWCFVSALSKILHLTIGPEALKAGVDGLAYFRFVPPAGATWRKADHL